MGKWLNQLRESTKTHGEPTDKTDETAPAKVLSVLSGGSDGVSSKFLPEEEGSAAGSASFVGSSFEPSRDFHACNEQSGWGEEDWLAAFHERAAILEFDQNMPAADAEAMAWREIEARRKMGMQ